MFRLPRQNPGLFLSGCLPTAMRAWLGAAAWAAAVLGNVAAQGGDLPGVIRVPGEAPLNAEVEFVYRLPAAGKTPEPARPRVLLLVPGMNGVGRGMLTRDWCRFADDARLVLFAPSFRTTEAEIRTDRGYYYPDQWSGRVTEQALAELERREAADVARIFLFGISAGAHFTHRFVLWNPKRVQAFVAYSAAWWDNPARKIPERAAGLLPPGLIMCGEADPRHAESLQFFLRGRALDAPWLWRSYRDTGHRMIPAVQRMAEVFLRHYALNLPAAPLAGDIQTYQILPAAAAEQIPEAVRVALPSAAVAAAWAKEE